MTARAAAVAAACVWVRTCRVRRRRRTTSLDTRGGAWPVGKSVGWLVGLLAMTTFNLEHHESAQPAARCCRMATARRLALVDARLDSTQLALVQPPSRPHVRHTHEISCRRCCRRRLLLRVGSRPGARWEREVGGVERARHGFLFERRRTVARADAWRRPLCDCVRVVVVAAVAATVIDVGTAWGRRPRRRPAIGSRAVCWRQQRCNTQKDGTTTKKSAHTRCRHRRPFTLAVDTLLKRAIVVVVRVVMIVVASLSS